MQEELLIKSELYNVKKIIKLLLIVGIIISIFLMFSSILSYARVYKNHEHNEKCYKSEYKEDFYYDDLCESLKLYKMYCLVARNDNVLEYIFYNIDEIACLTVCPIGISSLIGFFIYFITHGYELIITNNKITGKVHLIKKVDLPIDSISAIAIINFLKGIEISTSSGKIYFIFIKNVEEIYKIINNLLLERQSKNIDSSIKNINNSDGTEQIKKYKELLDTGIITQEEFDKKKKELLNL